MLEGYLTIGENLPQLEQYQELFGSNQYMRSALASIFEDILDFHAEAVKHFKQRSNDLPHLVIILPADMRISLEAVVPRNLAKLEHQN